MEDESDLEFLKELQFGRMPTKHVRVNILDPLELPLNDEQRAAFMGTPELHLLAIDEKTFEDEEAVERYEAMLDQIADLIFTMSSLDNFIHGDVLIFEIPAHGRLTTLIWFPNRDVDPQLRFLTYCDRFYEGMLPADFYFPEFSPIAFKDLLEQTRPNDAFLSDCWVEPDRLRHACKGAEFREGVIYHNEVSYDAVYTVVEIDGHSVMLAFDNSEEFPNFDPETVIPIFRRGLEAGDLPFSVTTDAQEEDEVDYVLLVGSHYEAWITNSEYFKMNPMKVDPNQNYYTEVPVDLIYVDGHTYDRPAENKLLIGDKMFDIVYDTRNCTESHISYRLVPVEEPVQPETSTPTDS